MKRAYILFVIISLNMQLFIAKTFAADFSELLDRIDSVRKQNNVPGLGLAIVSGEKTLYEASLGFADIEKNVSVKNNTVFRIGSITKTFTSLAMLRLVEQGKLNLNDKVSKHLKVLPYENTFESSAPIRIAHILEHTAGFQGLTKKEFDFKQPNWSVEESLAYDPASRITAWRPGEYPSYTNSGVGVAALLVEKVSQQSFEEFVDEQIFQLLNLRDATFFLDENIKTRLATGYDQDGITRIPYWHMLYRSFGAINMRVSDMTIFLRMLINNGKLNNEHSIFTAKSIRRMETPTTSLAARNGLTYGYGLGNYQWLHNGVLFHGHGGDADGYLAHYGYTRENNLGYFVVINAYNGKALRKIRGQIESWLISDIQSTSPPAIYHLTQEELEEIIGSYQAITERFPWMNQTTEIKTNLKIFKKQEKLFTQLGTKPSKQLIAVNNKHFRRVNQPIATLSIVTDKQGVQILQGDMGNYRKIK